MFAESPLEKNPPEWYKRFKIVARDRGHLIDLIEEAICYDEEGYCCDLNFIDVSQVTDMSDLFTTSSSYEYELDRFNGDISQWNVSNVTNMYAMFNESDFNGDISKWNVSNVTDMRRMFADSPLEDNPPEWYKRFKIVARDRRHLIELIEDAIADEGDYCDLNFIDVSQVTDMSDLFTTSSSYEYELDQFNGDISQWDVSNVTNMSGMFAGSEFNGDISQWDVSNVTNMSGMFNDSPLKKNPPKWYKDKGF